MRGEQLGLVMTSQNTAFLPVTMSTKFVPDKYVHIFKQIQLNAIDYSCLIFQSSFAYQLFAECNSVLSSWRNLFQRVYMLVALFRVKILKQQKEQQRADIDESTRLKAEMQLKAGEIAERYSDAQDKQEELMER